MRIPDRAPHGGASLAAVTILALVASAPGRSARSQDDAPELPEIVVTAERVERPARRVPMSVTAVTSGEIEDAGMADLGDVSEWVPDLTVVDWGSRRNTFIYIRGIGSSRQGESVVGVYVDDVPLLSNGVFMADLGELERIEVLRGPQGTLFGRNTLGGVVNIVTKPLPAETEGAFAASFGSDGWLEGRASFAGPLGGSDLRLGLSVFGSSRDGFTVNDLTGETVDGREAVGGRAKLSWVPSDSLEVTFSADAETDRDGGYALTQLSDVRSNPYHVMHDHEGWENRDVLGGSVRVKWSAPWGDLTSVTASREWELRSAIDEDFSPADIMQSLLYEEQWQFTQELRLASREGAAGPKWLLGVAYSYEDSWDGHDVFYGADAGLFGRSPGDFDASRSVNENSVAAIFGNVVWPAGERLEFSGGFRWSRERKSAVLEWSSVGGPIVLPEKFTENAEFEELVPRAGLAFEVSENTTSYLNIARGYRSGGFNDSLALGMMFDPEHSTNYELGYKTRSADGRARLNASAFYIVWEDQQVVQLFGPTFTYIANAGKSRSLGAEAELAFRPVVGVEFTAGLAYVDAEFVDYDLPAALPLPLNYDGNKMPMAREYEINLAAKFRRTLSNDMCLFARVGLRAHGEFYWDPANAFREEPHQFVDVRLGIEHRKWDVTLWARNLFSEDYASMVFAQGGMAVGQAGDPRTVGLTVKTRF